MASLIVTLGLRLGGVNDLPSALAGVLMCAAVYIFKIPSLLARAALLRFGYLVRFVGVAATDEAQRGALVMLLEKRDDIQIVFVGTPRQFADLSALSQMDLLDEIVLSGHEAELENVEALAGLAVMIVRVTPQDRLERRIFDPVWSRKTVHGPWGAPAAVIAQPPLRGWGGIAKRAIDIIGAAAATILLSPIMILCAVAIKLESPGPILFAQERAGFRNRPFKMLKFRSMCAEHTDPTGSKLTMRNDPRVTTIGAILRRTSADELPQLFNVLAGHMSLVGPRPHPKGAKAGATLYDELIPNFYARYRMKPGITGLAQVNGLRGNTQTEQHLIDRFRLDLEYAAQWTPFLDLAILVRTILHLWDGTNAF